MLRSRPLPLAQGPIRPSRLVVLVVLTGLALAATPASFAQFGGRGAAPPFQRPDAAPAQSVKIASPAPFQVFQRDASGRAEVPIVLDDSVKDAKITEARVNTLMTGMGNGTKFVDGKLVGVPTGGPYTINVTVKKDNITSQVSVGPVFVGDLWVLAGQSNMEGVGDLIDVTPPHPQVMCLGMDGKWARAEEPLHWLVDSPDPVHSGDPKDRAARSAQQHKTRTKGAGLGLPFAVALVEQTRVPIGLVACAHGGTSMEQWNPAKKGEGGNSLYGSMLRQIELAGGKVKGVLWYQGESDSSPEAIEDLRQGLHRLHRLGPGRPWPVRPAVLLRADRPVHQRRRSQGLERRAGSRAAIARARAQHGRRLGHRPGARRCDPRRHPGAKTRRAAAGQDRRRASCSVRSARPRRPSSGCPAVRTTR